LEPDELSREELDRLSEMLLDRDRPALRGREGFEIELPDPIFHVLVHVVRSMRKGQTILLMPEDETFTTQAAANFLGVSRPFLVKLLEDGQIPFFNAGSHRKVALKDLITYADRRSQARINFLDDMTEKLSEADLYDKVPEK
jgi:excisionase family DNA binding protein